MANDNGILARLLMGYQTEEASGNAPQLGLFGPGGILGNYAPNPGQQVAWTGGLNAESPADQLKIRLQQMLTDRSGYQRAWGIAADHPDLEQLNTRIGILRSWLKAK